MKGDCLVLNKSFNAIQIIGWQKAVFLVSKEHAEIIDSSYQTYNLTEWAELSKLMHDHPNGYITTVNQKIAKPDVIRLTIHDRLRNTDVKYTRENVYAHYRNTCSYCGHRFPTSELNLDHVIPQSRGGKKSWENIVLSCVPCNSRKANKTPEEAGMKLLVTPKRPRFKSITHSLFPEPRGIRESWQHFIDRAYWTTELEQS